MSLGNVPGWHPKEQIWVHSCDMASRESWWGFGSSSSSVPFWLGMDEVSFDESVGWERVVVVEEGEEDAFSAKDVVVYRRSVERRSLDSCILSSCAQERVARLKKCSDQQRFVLVDHIEDISG